MNILNIKTEQSFNNDKLEFDDQDELFNNYNFYILDRNNNIILDILIYKKMDVSLFLAELNNVLIKYKIHYRTIEETKFNLFFDSSVSFDINKLINLYSAELIVGFDKLNSKNISAYNKNIQKIESEIKIKHAKTEKELNNVIEFISERSNVSILDIKFLIKNNSFGDNIEGNYNFIKKIFKIGQNQKNKMILTS